MPHWPILALMTLAHGLGARSVLAVAPPAPISAQCAASHACAGRLVPARGLLGGVLMSVGLSFALVAEIGGARAAGLLTGVAVAFAWNGVLVGPAGFGLLLEATAASRLVLSAISLAVVLTLPLPRPLVQRDEHAVALERTVLPRAAE